MSAADVRKAKSAIFQPHYMKAIEAEYYARNELRMSRGMTSEPIATAAYWNSLKSEIGNELIPFYAVIGKSYVYFIYALITLCVLGSVIGFFFRLTKEWTANGCTPRLGVTLCQGVYHVVMVPIDFVKAGYNGVVDHQDGDGPSLSYLESLVNHLRTEFISLTATVLTLREQLAPYLVAGKTGSPPPPYFGNDGPPPPPPVRQESLDGPAHLRQLSNLDLPDIAALFSEEAAANTRRRSRDPTRGPSAPPIITEPTAVRRHVRTQSTHVRNAPLEPPPRQLPHNPNTVWIRSALGENGNLDGLPSADMSPCTASSLFPESPNELRSSMGFSMDPSTSYPRLPPLPPPLAPGTIGNPFPQPTIGTPLGEFMPAPGAATSSIRPITRSAEPAIKRPCPSKDHSPDDMEQDALLPDEALAPAHLASFREKIAKRIKQQDRPPVPQSHLDAAGGIRAVSDALERATGLPTLQLAQLPAQPPRPFQPVTSQPSAFSQPAATSPARNVTPTDARPPAPGDATCRMMDSLFKN